MNKKWTKCHSVQKLIQYPYNKSYFSFVFISETVISEFPPSRNYDLRGVMQGKLLRGKLIFRIIPVAREGQREDRYIRYSFCVCGCSNSLSFTLAILLNFRVKLYDYCFPVNDLSIKRICKCFNTAIKKKYGVCNGLFLFACSNTV